MENQIEKEKTKNQKFNIKLGDFSNESEFNIFIKTLEFDVTLVKSELKKCNICLPNQNKHLMQHRYHNCTNKNCCNRSDEINRQCFKVRKCQETNRMLLEAGNWHGSSQKIPRSDRKRPRLGESSSSDNENQTVVIDYLEKNLPSVLLSSF